MRRLPLLAALAAATACDGIVTIEEGPTPQRAVPPSEVAKVDLLDPRRRLPPSARNVRVASKSFLDTLVWVRFDAPAGEARAFAETMIGQPLTRDAFVNMRAPDDLDWWIKEKALERAERGEDIAHDGDHLPPSSVALIENGESATVWLLTFSN